MTNYCVDYFKVKGGYLDEGTYIFDTRTERAEVIESILSEGYTITYVYENENCYCQARSWGECGCGNFKE